MQRSVRRDSEERVDETGSVAPVQMDGHMPKVIYGDHTGSAVTTDKDGDFRICALAVTGEYIGVICRAIQKAQPVPPASNRPGPSRP